MRLVGSSVAVLLSIAGCSQRTHRGDRSEAAVHVVTQTGIPATGALWFVHAADGTLLDTGETEDGEARVAVEGGEMVTAFYAFTTDIGLDLVSVYTIAGVQPNDELFFPVQSFDSIGPDRGEVNLRLNGVSFPGADGYGYALAGCPGGIRTTLDPAGSENMAVTADCTGDAFEPYAIAGLQGPPIAFELLPSAPIATLMTDGVMFTGAWRTDFDLVGYSLTGIPANAYNFVVRHHLYDDEQRRLASNGAAAQLLGLSSTSGELVTIPFSTTAFALVETVANSTAGTISLLRSGAPGDDVSLDFAAMPGYLPGASAASVNGRLEISWVGGPSDADIVELSANYGVAENRNVGWRFRLAGETVSPFRFPEWPPDINGDAPPASADLVDLGSVRFTDGEWAGWDDARQDDPRDDLRTSDRRIVERILD